MGERPEERDLDLEKGIRTWHCSFLGIGRFWPILFRPPSGWRGRVSRVWSSPGSSPCPSVMDSSTAVTSPLRNWTRIKRWKSEFYMRIFFRNRLWWFLHHPGKDERFDRQPWTTPHYAFWTPRQKAACIELVRPSTAKGEREKSTPTQCLAQLHKPKSTHSKRGGKT